MAGAHSHTQTRGGGRAGPEPLGGPAGRPGREGRAPTRSRPAPEPRRALSSAALRGAGGFASLPAPHGDN